MKGRSVQFQYIDQARRLTFDWVNFNQLNLHTMEFILPFVLEDKSLPVWLFVDTNKRLAEYTANGILQKIKDKFLENLNKLGYPGDYLLQVTFNCDSDENVQLNYEGSYFYRLR